MGSDSDRAELEDASENAGSEGTRACSAVGRVQTVVVGSLQENCYLVDDGRGGVAVVDPGDDWARIEAAIAGRRVDVVLVTHFHADHVGALGELLVSTGAPWVIGAPDAKMLQPGTSRATNPRYAAVEVAVPAERLLVGRDVVEAGELRFEVIDCPGHSRGGVTYYERRCGLAFTGDTLFAGSCGRTDLEGGSGRAILSSLARLAKLPEDVRVLPGHGPASTIGAERATNPYVRRALAHE